jgi:hypothetical protein
VLKRELKIIIWLKVLAALCPAICSAQAVDMSNNGCGTRVEEEGVESGGRSSEVER